MVRLAASALENPRREHTHRRIEYTRSLAPRPPPITFYIYVCIYFFFHFFHFFTADPNPHGLIRYFFPLSHPQPSSPRAASVASVAFPTSPAFPRPPITKQPHEQTQHKQPDTACRVPDATSARSRLSEQARRARLRAAPPRRTARRTRTPPRSSDAWSEPTPTTTSTPS